MMQTILAEQIVDEERFRLNFQIERLNALRQIDLAINSSFDPYVVLNVILDQVMDHLHVDAAAALLFDPQTQLLEYAAARGFHTKAPEHTRLRLGEGPAGKAALYRRTSSIQDLHLDAGDPGRTLFLASERFVGYYAVPLVAKGEVKGVLEVYQRTRRACGKEWLDSLNVMGVQAAIAIDNASLFNSLQRSNAELARAYDSTIEGWARALDLRDCETEGHTQRVADWTVGLAQRRGVHHNGIEKIRWGSLLHDIGKLGVPDQILFKAGPLTDDEWKVMRKHPDYARSILEPIPHLRPALDIPYCHHEKWDGTGYPRGLKGEQIPLAARMFAVVDVWDALCSDRPYRPAWPKDQAREYIAEQKGKHFDPEIVPAFLEMVSG